jgi:outer membrane protein assembly factor BamB
MLRQTARFSSSMRTASGVRCRASLRCSERSTASCVRRLPRVRGGMRSAPPRAPKRESVRSLPRRTAPAAVVRTAIVFVGICAAFAPYPCVASDDWVTYAHDDRRTGFQSSPTGISRSTVGTLRLQWSVALRETVTSSPIVAGGTAFVATERGNVYALRTDDGHVRWRRNVGNSVRMTPALSHGRLLVGVYGFYGTPTKRASGASFQALDPASGHLLWKTPLPGVVRSEPVVVGSVIYEGIAGGDADSGCERGRIVTLDERTGKLLAGVWYTSTKPRNGGGIWSPLSFDGATIFFGTGNTCDGTGAQDAVVAINPALKTRWATPAQSPDGADEDVGGGAMIRGELVYVEGKSGRLYALDRRTGGTKWTADVHADTPGGGGFATPAGDGTVLVVNSGDGASQPEERTKLVAFDVAGRERYEIDQHTVSTPSLGASFVRGVGFAAIDKAIVAFDAQTGATLWTYRTADAFYAVPAIVSSGIYTVDLSGNVYAFGRGAVKNASATTKPTTVGHGDRGVVVEKPAFEHRRAIVVGAPFGLAIAVAAGLYLFGRRRRRR